MACGSVEDGGNLLCFVGSMVISGNVDDKEVYCVSRVMVCVCVVGGRDLLCVSLEGYVVNIWIAMISHTTL